MGWRGFGWQKAISGIAVGLGVIFAALLFVEFIETPDRVRKAALSWALDATQKCEKETPNNGYKNVAECLEFEIWEIEHEIRMEKISEAQAQGEQP